MTDTERFSCLGCSRSLSDKRKYIIDNDGEYWHLKCAMLWSKSICTECELITDIDDIFNDDDNICPECGGKLRELTRKEALKIQRERLTSIEFGFGDIKK